MIPATIDFPCQANADYAEQLFFHVDGVPLDLSGISFDMQIRRYPNGPFMFQVVITIVDAPGGKIEIYVPQNIMDTMYDQASVNMNVVTLSHDLRAIHSDGFIEPWAKGTFSIEPGVTRYD